MAPEMKQSEKIDKIYYAVFGMNGADGLLNGLKRTDGKIDALFKKWDEFILTRRETCPVKKSRMDSFRQAIGWILQAAAWATLFTKLVGLW